ncbi:MAG: 2-polyprenyl-3-methyl-6-methoxy-1,4-benzoquinone monooxygenase [Proteobacteria bacterium]|nr:2-polyprenyl-3-methyl-6-methoxy-1,4-benzoquinone monooxygenase [Pseudomonadota bacterium]
MRSEINSFPDKILSELDRFLKVVGNEPALSEVSIPGEKDIDIELSPDVKKHTAGLMRINHTGEICAQALYYGQALFAKDESTKKQLHQAAKEEHDHLFWCDLRLKQLDNKPSVFNPIWYISSFSLGSFAALFGDAVSYGFVIETERQVEAHIQDHIDDISEKDLKTQKILKQMQADEIRHGENAKAAGGIELPEPVKAVMTGMSKLMKFIAYRI